MATTNKHNLPRTIPDPIKRQIRQNSGFGCVICGMGVYEYEHVDPEWHDAFSHNPDFMTLLCPRHHNLVTGGMGTKGRVKKAMLTPFSKQAGFSREEFELGDTVPDIQFAGVTLKNCRVPIEIFGDPLFEIKEREAPGAPFRLSGNFYDSQGKLSLRIIDNEWQAMADNWDVEVVGPTITVREAKGKIHLQLTAKPPGGISVDRLNMTFEGVSFVGDKKNLKIYYMNDEIADFTLIATSGFEAGLAIIKHGGEIKRTAGLLLEI